MNRMNPIMGGKTSRALVKKICTWKKNKQTFFYKYKSFLQVHFF